MYNNYTKEQIHHEHLDNGGVPLVGVAILAEINRYFPPICAPIGIIGNILCLVVLLNKSTTRPANIYMCVFAMTDIMVLCFWTLMWLFHRFPKWLSKTGVIVWCKIGIFGPNTFIYISVYLLIIGSIERLIAVKFPFKASTLCTRKLAKCMVIAVCVIVTGIHMHNFFTRTSLLNKLNGRVECNIIPSQFVDPNRSRYVFLSVYLPWIQNTFIQLSL